MYLEIETYMKDILDHGDKEALERASYLIQGFYKAKLLKGQEYAVLMSQVKKRLVELGEGLNGFRLERRARTILERSDIRTKADLRNVLIGESPDKHFLKLRNMGLITACKVVREALENDVITYDEIGKGYTELWEVKQWKLIKEKLKEDLEE